jgi:hypothetical protein
VEAVSDEIRRMNRNLELLSNHNIMRRKRDIGSLVRQTYSSISFAPLDRDEGVSLRIFLSHHLEKLVGLSKMLAAEYTGMMLSKSESTIRQWRANLSRVVIIARQFQQGQYQQSGVLWSSKDLNKKESVYVCQVHVCVREC